MLKNKVEQFSKMTQEWFDKDHKAPKRKKHCCKFCKKPMEYNRFYHFECLEKREGINEEFLYG